VKYGGDFMVKRVSGRPSAQPIAQPAPVKKTGVSTQLKTVSINTSNFMLGRGKNLLSAGKLPEYSDRPTKDSKRVVRTVTGLIVQSKKPRHK
jgi:hypothetical protein